MGSKRERALKSGEKELLAQVFVKTLPFDEIIITDKLGIDDRPYTLPEVFSKKYNVNIGDDYYDQDMSETSGGRRLLIHECVHVWQGVHGFVEWGYVLNSIKCQALSHFSEDSAYDYEVGKEWDDYNAEQQAEIVEDWAAEGMKITSNKWKYIRDHLREPGFGGKAYFFKNAEYVRWTIGEGIDSGYPRSTSSAWNDFVQTSRSGFSRLVGETEYYYFFDGEEYLKWKSGSGPMDGYPRKISASWNSSFIANGIDGVLNPDTNQVYFFKGDEYTRHTMGEGQDAGYPKKIADSWDAPFIKNGFDSCIYWGNGKAYFFKGDEYIRYTLGKGVDSGYPKKIGDNWHSAMRSGLNIGLLKRLDIF
ncbi:MAG: hypothetical protein ACI837_002624 [Crocinitomicaceae bacterium]|jgi:hypothetical protein